MPWRTLVSPDSRLRALHVCQPQIHELSAVIISTPMSTYMAMLMSILELLLSFVDHHMPVHLRPPSCNPILREPMNSYTDVGLHFIISLSRTLTVGTIPAPAWQLYRSVRQGKYSYQDARIVFFAKSPTGTALSFSRKL